MHRTSSKTQDVSCQGLCVPERASSTQRKHCGGGRQDLGEEILGVTETSQELPFIKHLPCALQALSPQSSHRPRPQLYLCHTTDEEMGIRKAG